MNPSLSRRLAAALLGALAFLPAPCAAWSPATRQAIALDAARLAPPDLSSQLARHTQELAASAREPLDEEAAADPAAAAGEDGGGALTRRLAADVAGAVSALRDFLPFAEVSRRLGRVAQRVAELNNPLNASSADPEEGRYVRDYLRYVDSARPRFAVVLYENSSVVASAADLAPLTHRALGRGRDLYPLVGREYRRIGFASGLERFDDRSSAFGVAALGYSHAVSDVARVFRYVWLAGGGADPRPVLDRPRERLLLLRGGAP